MEDGSPGETPEAPVVEKEVSLGGNPPPRFTRDGLERDLDPHALGVQGFQWAKATPVPAQLSRNTGFLAPKATSPPQSILRRGAVQSNLTSIPMTQAPFPSTTPVFGTNTSSTGNVTAQPHRQDEGTGGSKQAATSNTILPGSPPSDILITPRSDEYKMPPPGGLASLFGPPPTNSRLDKQLSKHQNSKSKSPDQGGQDQSLGHGNKPVQGLRQHFDQEGARSPHRHETPHKNRQAPLGPVGDLTFPSSSPQASRVSLSRKNDQRNEMSKPMGQEAPTSYNQAWRPDSRVSNMSMKRAPQQRHVRPSPYPFFDPAEGIKRFGSSWNNFYDELTEETRRINEELAERTEALEASVQEVAAQENTNGQLRRHLNSLMKEKREHEEVVAKRVADLRDKGEAAIQERTDRIAELEGETHHLRADRESRVKRYESEIGQIRADRDAKLEKLEGEVELIRADRDAISQQLEKKREGLGKAQDRVKRYREQINKILEDFETELNKSKEHVDNVIQAAHKEKSEAMAIVKEAWEAGERGRRILGNISRSAMDVLKQHKAEASIVISGLEGQLEETKQNLARERETVDTLRNELQNQSQTENTLLVISKTTRDLSERLSGAIESPTDLGFKQEDSGPKQGEQKLDAMVTRMEAMTGGLAILPQSIKLLSDVHEKHLGSVLEDIGSLEATHTDTERHMRSVTKELSENFENLSKEMLKIRDEAQRALKQSKETDRLATLLASKEAEYEERSSAYKGAQVRMLELEGRIRDYELRNRELEVALKSDTAAGGRITELQDHLKNMSAELQVKSLDIERVQEQLRAETAKSATNREVMKEEIVGLQANLRVAEERHRLLQEHYKEALAKAEKDVEDNANTRQKETHHALESHQKNIQALQDNLVHANKCLGTLSAQHKEAENNLRKAERSLAETREEQTRLEEKLQHLSKEKTSVEADLHTARDKQEALGRQLKAVVDGTNRRNSAYNDGQDEKIADLVAEIDHLKSNIASEKARNKEDAEKAKGLDTRLAEVIKEVSALRSQAGKDEVRYQQTSAKASGHLQQAQKAERDLVILRKRLDNDQKTHLDQIGEIQGQNVLLEKESRMYKTRFEEVSQKYATCAQENSTLQERLILRGSELQQELSEARKELEALKTKLNTQSKLPSGFAASGIQWSVDSALPINNWKKWDGYVCKFLVQYGSKLDAGERKEIDPHIELLKGAMAFWDTSLENTFICVEGIAAREKWGSEDIKSARDLGMLRKVVVQSPVVLNAQSPSPISVEAEKEQRRRANQPLSILRNHPPVLDRLGDASSLDGPSIKAPPQLRSGLGVTARSTYNRPVAGASPGMQLLHRMGKRSQTLGDETEGPDSKRSKGQEPPSKSHHFPPMSIRVAEVAKRSKVTVTYGTRNRNLQGPQESKSIMATNEEGQSQNMGVEAIHLVGKAPEIQSLATHRSRVVVRSQDEGGSGTIRGVHRSPTMINSNPKDDIESSSQPGPDTQILSSEQAGSSIKWGSEKWSILSKQLHKTPET